MLRVYIDFSSAGCWLAIDPVADLAERTGVPIHWRAFRTRERDVPDSGADAGVIESHQQTREAARRAIDVIYAEARGIELAYPAQPGSCELALGALAEITSGALPFVRAAFDAYWRDHADLDDAEVVAALIKASGADHSGDFSATRDAFAAAEAEAEAAGVVDAPAIIVSGQLFIGRQHLPWVEEILASTADAG